MVNKGVMLFGGTAFGDSGEEIHRRIRSDFHAIAAGYAAGNRHDRSRYGSDKK